jgi:hypothetical protein
MSLQSVQLAFDRIVNTKKYKCPLSADDLLYQFLVGVPAEVRPALMPERPALVTERPVLVTQRAHVFRRVCRAAQVVHTNVSFVRDATNLALSHTVDPVKRVYTFGLETLQRVFQVRLWPRLTRVASRLVSSRLVSPHLPSSFHRLCGRL